MGIGTLRRHAALRQLRTQREEEAKKAAESKAKAGAEAGDAKPTGGVTGETKTQPDPPSQKAQQSSNDERRHKKR